MLRITVPTFVRDQFANTPRFTAAQVTKAIRAAGIVPKRHVVGTALWRMALTGELVVENAPSGAYWTHGHHRIYSWALESHK